MSIAGPSLQAEHNYGTVMTAIETGPSHMPSFVYVLSVPQIHAVADYVTKTIAVIPLTGGNLGNGGELFRMYCAACHRTAARGGALAFTGVNAPALVGKSPALVAGAIRWGPGPMPKFPPAILSDRQLASIVDYVTFVQRPPDPGGNPLRYYGPVAEGFIGFVAVLLLIAVSMWVEMGGNG
jgi:quinol---cytochrome-c reductase cytochrome c subunit